MSFIVSETRDGITTITLNRPEKLNAFAGAMREELLAALQAAENDAQTRLVAITGAGRAFCAGGDVAFMAALQEKGDVEGFRRLLEGGARVVLQIVEMSKPVLAAVNGVAAGAGCNLALACDYRLASHQARFGQTFIRIGLHPDWGGSWFLPRLVGRGRALELMMTGRMVEAEEALAIGLVDRLAADLPRDTREIANAIAAASPLVVAGIKRSLRESEKNDLRAQLEVEAEIQSRAFLSDQSVQKVKAFLKTSP
jgi:2-(1,2-epoxy-1,2-dihydrophenyl)acetyl-CoA isomerase